MNKQTKKLSFLVLAFLLLSACSPATDPAADGGVAPEPGETIAEEPSAGGAPQAGPSEVVITGDFSVTYTPIHSVVSYIGGQYEIFLQLESDSAFPLGVRIFVPEDIQPGSYPIANLVYIEDGVTARFDNFVDGTLDYFESTDGSIELTATGDSYSGSFAFSAADPRDQSRSISVIGNFSGVTAVQ